MTIACLKDFTVTINPAINWGSMLWTIDLNQQINAGTNTFSPLNGQMGSVWHDLSNSPVAPPDGARCQSHGDLMYNGPGANFNVHVDVNYTLGIGGINGTFGELEVFVNGVSQGIINYQEPFPPNVGPGSYDYPFTLPNTGGIPIPVRVRTDQSAGAVTAVPTMFEMTVTVTNI